MKYQEIVSRALEANYGGHEILDRSQEMRLATSAVSRSLEFSTEVDRWGHKYHFNSNDADITTATESEESSDATDETGRSLRIKVRKLPDQIELQEILHAQEQLAEPSGRNILVWLKGVYKSSQGFELGTFNPSILATIMKKQSTNWIPLSRGYISDIAVIVHNFITTVV